MQTVKWRAAFASGLEDPWCLLVKTTFLAINIYYYVRQTNLGLVVLRLAANEAGDFTLETASLAISCSNDKFSGASEIIGSYRYLQSLVNIDACIFFNARRRSKKYPNAVKVLHTAILRHSIFYLPGLAHLFLLKHFGGSASRVESGTACTEKGSRKSISMSYFTRLEETLNRGANRHRVFASSMEIVRFRHEFRVARTDLPFFRRNSEFINRGQ